MIDQAMHLYSQGADKRFEIEPPIGEPSESYISPREALSCFRDAWNELYEVNQPYLLGAVLYGSAVKGRFSDHSDIDCMVFADPDERQGQSGAEMEAHIMQIMSAAGQGEHPVHFDVSEKSPDQKLVLINEKIIDEFVVQTQKQYLESVEQDPDDAEYFVGTKKLFGPFMMRFGQGKLQYLREYILDSLEIYTESQQQADAMWRAIAEAITWYEEARPRSHGEKAQPYLPQTIAQARMYFHV